MAKKANSKAISYSKLSPQQKAAITRKARAAGKDPARVHAALKGWETRGEVKITVDEHEGVGQEIAAEIVAKSQKALAQLMVQAVAIARANAPVATGRMQSSIQGRLEGTKAVITVDAPYAKFQEYGTGEKPPYTAKDGTIMVFKPGTYKYPPGWARVVENHKGNPAAEFMKKATDHVAENGAAITANIVSS